MLFNGKTDKIMLHAMNSFSAASEPSVTSRMFLKGTKSILAIMLKTQLRIIFQVSPMDGDCPQLSAVYLSKITVSSVLVENCRVYLLSLGHLYRQFRGVLSWWFPRRNSYRPGIVSIWTYNVRSCPQFLSLEI